jgi:hypothetical protein
MATPAMADSRCCLRTYTLELYCHGCDACSGEALGMHAGLHGERKGFEDGGGGSSMIWYFQLGGASPSCLNEARRVYINPQ